jgi:hypothetical protein
MRSQSLPQAESRRGSRLEHISRGFAFSLAATAAIALMSTALAHAQSQTNPSPAPAAPPVHHARTHKKPAAVTPAPEPPPPAAPVAPPPPNWPANDLPGAASVVFDSRGLLVVASNSSLSQILKEISVETGAKVEGFDADQRVFGTYGPAPVRDVIAQLLDGSGYDVLMVGDRGEGTPRRIVLSERSGAGAAPRNMANNATPPPGNDDTENDDQPEPQAEPPQPVPGPGSNGPPVPIRTPQQMMQEIQERQRQQQQQQQNGQQNPQN